MHVISHRGLDFENHHTYTESSREAFEYFLGKGYGLEFDVRITKDLIPVISHDASMSRLTDLDEPEISEMSVADFKETKLPNGTTLTLSELTTRMQDAKDTTTCVHALHLKHQNQTQAELDVLIPYLSKLAELPLILFDAKPEVARQLKQAVPHLQIAASVAHPYDIQRYNDAVGGTLVSVADMKDYTDIFDWVWLDEWDRTDEASGKKALYTQETFSQLRELGYKIAVISPELHATSPKLLGGESHQDASDRTTLGTRWNELALLTPDAICTDYPHYVSTL